MMDYGYFLFGFLIGLVTAIFMQDLNETSKTYLSEGRDECDS